jgi:hypothetical protein
LQTAGFLLLLHQIKTESQEPPFSVKSTSITSVSMAAQTQLLSPSEPRWNHDVFLSFRGKDTRKTFTDHLYTALVHAGIHTFRDDDELPRGNHISNELLKAIQGSRVSIVVFSKGYASSSWCLDELVEILHCKNTIGQTFLPIFYDVNPSDRPDLLPKHFLGTKSGFRRRWRGCRNGKQLLLKLQTIPVGISKTLQTGIISYDLLCFLMH